MTAGDPPQAIDQTIPPIEIPNLFATLLSESIAAIETEVEFNTPVTPTQGGPHRTYHRAEESLAHPSAQAQNAGHRAAILEDSTLVPRKSPAAHSAHTARP